MVSIGWPWLPRPFERIRTGQSAVVARLLHACARLRTLLKVVVQDEELGFLYKSTRLDGCLGFRAGAGEFVSVVARTGVRGVGAAILPNDRAHINVS